jgi:hypothetical protein
MSNEYEFNFKKEWDAFAINLKIKDNIKII